MSQKSPLQQDLHTSNFIINFSYPYSKDFYNGFINLVY